MFNSGFNESTARISPSPRRTSSQFDELNDEDSELETSSGDDAEDGGIDEDDNSEVDESDEDEDDEDPIHQRQPLAATPRAQATVPFPTSADLSIASPPPRAQPVAVAPSTPRSRTSSAVSNDGDSADTNLSPVTGDRAEPSNGEASESDDPSQRLTTPPQSPSRFRSAPSSPAHGGFPLSMSQLPTKVVKKRESRTEKFVRPRSEVVVADAS